MVRAFPLLLAACSLSQEAFIDRYGEQTCAWLETCTDASQDRRDCLAEQAEGLDALITLGCVYDADAARDCVDQREGATCDDPFGLPTEAEACGRVVDCEG